VPSEAIRGDQRRSEAIRGVLRSFGRWPIREAIREAIRETIREAY
jgi:hypothetical protein